MKFVVFALIAAIAFAAVSAAPQGEVSEGEAQCSPWLGRCSVTDDCCRHLICSPYQAKCVPHRIIGGEDTRPIGGKPYPPTRP